MTFAEARDYIFGVFRGVWDEDEHPVQWPGLPASLPEQSEKPWARVALRHSVGEQASLSNSNGVRRWNRQGTLFIQIFVPMGEGLDAAYELAQTVVNAYEEARHENVWFRKPRMTEIGPSGAFEQVNVMVDVSYDTVR